MAKRKSKVKADKSTVYNYKHFLELRDCLASGWSPSMVIDYMVERHGPEGVPGEKAVQRWRDLHMGTDMIVIPHQFIREKLKGIDYKVDVLGHYSRLVAICEDRVGRGLTQEANFGDMPLEVNDGVIHTYLDAMAGYIKVAQDLGILKSPAPAPLIDARTNNYIVTPEIITRLQETVREIKTLELTGVKSGKTGG